MPSQGLGERLGSQLSYTLSSWQAFRMPTESFSLKHKSKGSRSSGEYQGQCISKAGLGGTSLVSHEGKSWRRRLTLADFKGKSLKVLSSTSLEATGTIFPPLWSHESYFGIFHLARVLSRAKSLLRTGLLQPGSIKARVVPDWVGVSIQMKRVMTNQKRLLDLPKPENVLNQGCCSILPPQFPSMLQKKQEM